MTFTENIFLTWALFSGGLALIVATLILLFNSTTDAIVGTSIIIAAWGGLVGSLVLTSGGSLRPCRRSFQNTTRYTALAPDRFKSFWRD